MHPSIHPSIHPSWLIANADFQLTKIGTQTAYIHSATCNTGSHLPTAMLEVIVEHIQHCIHIQIVMEYAQMLKLSNIGSEN
jgi:hypothetical protein